jgi:hypothetical protein
MIVESSEPIEEGLSEDETEGSSGGVVRPLVEGVGVGRRKEERVGGSQEDERMGKGRFCIEGGGPSLKNEKSE